MIKRLVCEYLEKRARVRPSVAQEEDSDRAMMMMLYQPDRGRSDLKNIIMEERIHQLKLVRS